MISDPRLQFFDPRHKKYIYERDQTASDFKALYSLEKWKEFLMPLSNMIIIIAKEELKPHIPDVPQELSEPIASVWKSLAQSICEQTYFPSDNPVAMVLIEMLGISMATQIENSLDLWEKVFIVLRQYGSASLSFVDSLSEEKIRDLEKDIMKLPQQGDGLELLESFEHLSRGDNQYDYLTSLKRGKMLTSDPWSFLKEIHEDADTIALRDAVWFRCMLMERLGEKTWINWLGSLPLSLLRVAAFQEVRSLDRALNLIDIALSHPDLKEGLREEILILLVMRNIELWTQIEGQLSQGVSRRVYNHEEYPEFYKNAIEELTLWNTNELPQRAERLSSTLLNDPTGLGSRVAIHVVRHLFFKCSDDIHASPKCKITPIIRSAFIQSMKKSGKSLDYFLDNILSDPISTAPLLNGARILFEYDLGPDEGLSKRIEKVWNAYTQFLRDNKHFWSAPLRDDEQETAWSIAGILALDTNPVKLLATLLKDIEVAPEGWQYDHQKYLESLPSVAHVLTIGAMATEWLYKHEHKKEGGILFEYIWKYIHGWLRSVSHQVVYSDHIKTAFIQTWARLYLVCGSLSTDKAKSEIIRLDHLDLMLEAANNFQKNQNISSGSLKLDPQLQHIIRQRFVEMFNIFRLYRNITPENAENYRKIMKELTPDIDESEVN